MSDKTIKLQKYMSMLGIASRRASEALIEKKLVTVNGAIAHIGQRVDPDKDTVEYNGKKFSSTEEKRYFIINKPVGFVSSREDELERDTVTELLPESVSERLYPVGRLDLESEGLLLLTNDGALTQKLTHPKFEIAKTYHVRTNRTPSFEAIMHLRRGVKLKEGYTKEALVDKIESTEDACWISITITEGWNQQVRRMFERVGYPVQQLIRVEMGPLKLEMLGQQRVRELTKEEIAELKKL